MSDGQVDGVLDRDTHLSGPVLLSYLEHTPVLSRIPVIVVSGFLEDQPTQYPLNVVARLEKPIRIDVVLQSAAAALKKGLAPKSPRES